ncbi:YueI family protein [Caldalkalibacillus salinus]|uniref:YueI family protein n=1 Tax=Caldalkalibacillus salinus TaxID=2803787 RepID=UPI0019208347|nr:YueI family protein [Caldalkalibacillus salinus]
MSEEKIEHILKQGIYGTPETKPEERKLFLSTLRERVYIALTMSQVKEKDVYPEVEQQMKGILSLDQVHMYLNGHLDYSYLSKYIQLATKYNCPFTMVQNNTHHSPMGLVLADEEAVERDSIYIEDALFKQDIASVT